MPAMAQPNPEPSMEDILASIKRIIAEDSEAVGARPAKARREAMAAVSSSPVVAPVEAPEPEEEQPEVGQAETADAEPATTPEPTAEEGDAPDVLELTSPMPETPSAPAAPDGLLSSTSAEASRNAFAALSQMQVRSDEGKSNTLEGLVADLLRPMLKDWLDRELPGIVERLVSAEVKRLAGG
jgi:cell pole-organizing protein PopZ